MKKNYFTIDSILLRTYKGYSKIFNIKWFMALLLVVFAAGCKKVIEEPGVVGLCPIVVSTDPMDKSVNVVLNKVISATFNTNMKATTINNTTFTIKQGSTSTLISGTIAPSVNGATFTFTPSVALLPFTTYTGTITTGVTDTFRTAMVSDYVWTFTTIPQITLSSNPVAGGTATGAGTFAQGSVVTVSATPNTGFTFTNWTVNGTPVSTSSSYQFTMNGNIALVANFTPVTAGNFAVNLSSNPAAGGTTTGAGSYPTGSTVTVTALPNTFGGYTFTNWTENGTIVSTSSSYTFALNANRTLVANFSLIPASQFAVILSSNPPAGGTTTGSGSYSAGSSVTVIATQNVGYTFTNWTENGTIVSTSSSYTFAFNANRTLVANFVLNTYTLNVTAINGTIVKNPNQATYNHGTTVQLTATPNAGYIFKSWSGDATGSTNPLTVTMIKNTNITANFTAIYTLNVTATNGTVVKNPNQATYDSGTTVQLTATANPGYIFSSWSGNATGSTNPLTVTMNANKNIIANFTANQSAGGPGVVDLGGAGNFVMLSEAGITNVPTSAITGNIGAYPITGAAITGLGCPEVTGLIYTADAAGPPCRTIDPVLLLTAKNNMETAYTTANNLVTPAPIVEQSAGNLNGQTLAPGLYKWSTGVSITTGITLAGGPNDTWVFQIAGDLIVNNGAIITLSGGAQPKNIVWVVAGSKADLGTTVDFSGIILSKNLISLNTGAKVTGRLLSQKNVTLIKNIVIQP